MLFAKPWRWSQNTTASRGNIVRKINNTVLWTLLCAALFTACGQGAKQAAGDVFAKETGGDSAPKTCSLASTAEPVRSHFAADEVTSLCTAAVAKLEQRLSAISSIAKQEATAENTLLPFESALADFSDETSILTFQGYVSTDAAVSAEGSACEEKLGQYYVDIFTRRPLYQVLSGLKVTEPSQIRLLTKTLESFEQNGLKLDDAALAQVKDLKSKLSTKESQFSANLNADVSTVAFTAEQLAGAPADFLSRLKKDGEKYVVTTKSTDYLDVMQNVSVEATRKEMMLTYLNRGGAANTQLLEEAVQLRAQIAKVLGYANWADYRTSGRMAKSAANVTEFLNNLKGKLAIRNQQDQQQLLAYKKELDPSATALNQWDVTYLSYQLQKRDYSIDNEKIREYLPAETVVAGIFDTYSKLLGVSFLPMPKTSVWAEGVKVYEIHNASDCQLIGYFYTDLIPRPGKYGHAAAFPLVSGRATGANQLVTGYSLPVASIVANFTPPTGEKPSLLTHDEVETFFHEFGHIMHQTLTKAPYASLSGAGVAQDFVEAPSQMLENWVWNSDILSRISGHYLHPEQKLPQDILQKMLAARNFQQGAAYTKQLLYALFDMTLHTQEGPVDVTKTYDELYRQIVGQEPLSGAHFPASFGHLMGGYDAGYYGYLWSEVYAQDMFSQFPADLTDAAVGSRYRHAVLEQGNMKDAIDLLREFLGREPNADAFFKKLGL
jgi:thimet oligopeptidase